MIQQSTLIEKITEYTQSIQLNSKKETALFQKAFIDTITNTVSPQIENKFFVATGDIPAMWLRDSTFQVLPYLAIVEDVKEVKLLLHGVINQQMACIAHDPYANAFNKTATDAHYSHDQSNIPISPFVWERKFEIDSLCGPLFLAAKLFEQTRYDQHLTEEFWHTTNILIDVFIKEQHHEKSDYRFQRTNCPPTDTLPNGGKGTPVGYTGMVWSGFRPSDDACQYGYFVPGNLFIIVVLKKMLPILEEKQLHPNLQQKMKKLIVEIDAGIRQHAIVKPENFDKEIYAYEVDGLGNYLLMDDANVPSLLSLPFLEYCSDSDALYKQTREFILSDRNPYYFSGNYLAGIGSPHTPENHVWPISIAMEGLTSMNKLLIEKCLKTIATTDNDTLQCHEGIDVNNPSDYTREWFSWANMTYCHLALHYRVLTKD